MTTAPESVPVREPLLRVEGLTKEYVQRKRFSIARFRVRALHGVDLKVRRGATLAIIGESGAGKSTLARCLALLETPTHGQVWFDGREVLQLSRRGRRELHSKIQLVFQDPASAFNPRLSVAEIIEEPLRIQGESTPAAWRRSALAMLDRVGLLAISADKRAHELSGGQRQRLAIARALVLGPQLLIFDEALSGLDPLNQERILKLLADLQHSFSLTYIHICHDLRLAQAFADEIAVMHNGRIVEQNAAAALFEHPSDSYTQRLIAAAPSLDSILEQRFA
jgi:ABC-type glutathione transport system ATPase component